MRLGLLGLGRIGAFHAETLTSLPTVDSLVVSDPMSALVEEVAGRLGTHVADTPEALLASGVDGVVIAAPTDLHPELILRCVAAGIPAFHPAEGTQHSEARPVPTRQNSRFWMPANQPDSHRPRRTERRLSYGLTRLL
jgi:hypothetical protein